MMELGKNMYFNQLNGLRFVAIFLVLLEHWLPNFISYPTGHLGVVIFFVLSGFLITRILIIKSIDPSNKSKSIFQKIKNFVFRRALRIFPIYFLVLFIGLLVGIEPIRKLYPWFFTYSPNFYIIFHKTWIGVWDHFWTLAVEEQYYLLFPFLIFLVRPSYYKYVLISMIVIGFMSRLLFFLLLPDAFVEEFWFLNYVNPISALDSFGMGGLLAYLHIYHRDLFEKIGNNNWGILFFGILCLFSYYFDEHSLYEHNNVFSSVLEITFFVYLSFFIVAKVGASKTGIFGAFFLSKPINYLGTISYGLYVYHNFVFNYYHFENNTLWWYITRNIPLSYLELINFVPLKFVLNFTVLVVIASISWFFIEKPINDLKNKFE